MRKGIILLLSSALFFALSTVFAKFANSGEAGVAIPGVEITFFRFLIGAVFALLYFLFKRENLRPVKTRYVVLRSLLNVIAIVFFFTGIQLSTVTNANMLNMTYPIFVYLFSPFINREKRPNVYYAYLFFTMTGVFFVINPEINNINLGDILALASGIVAGFAISVLREARKYDSAFIVFFYLMTIGTVANFFIMAPFFVVPTNGVVILYVAMAALLGVLGQICITVGYKYIDASSGALISSSRILYATIFGVILFYDPISINIVIGGTLILISLTGVSGGWKLLRKKIAWFSP